MKKIYLIDGNSLIYRMFFAVPPFSTSSGKQVNALFGVAKFFLGQMIQEHPDYLIFIRDAKGENFRHEVYSEYKAQRERMPDALREQVDDINLMVNTMGFEVIEIPGYEADDVIATLAKKFERDYNVFVLSGDKDLHALVGENVKIYDTIKRKIYGPKETQEKFEVPPNLVTDYLAIVGDSSDNFPGVAGIGPKKAVVLLNAIGTMEKIYEVVDRIQSGEKVEDIQEVVENIEAQKILSGKTLEKFIEGRELAFISKKLATLAINVPMEDIQLERYLFHPEKLSTPEIIELFKTYEFKSLVTTTDSSPEFKRWEDTGLEVKIIGDIQSLIELEKTLEKFDEVFFDTETTNIVAAKADLVGISVYLDNKHIYYINLLHRGPQVPKENVKSFLKQLFASNKKIIGHNIKYDLEVVERFLDNATIQKYEPIRQDSLF